MRRFLQYLAHAIAVACYMFAGFAIARGCDLAPVVLLGAIGGLFSGICTRLT